MEIITGNNTPMLYMGDAKLLTEDDLRKSKKRRREDQSALTRLGNLQLGMEGAPSTTRAETLRKRARANMDD